MRVFLKNKKGIMLVTSYMVIAVLIILTIGFATRTVGEQRVASKERDSIQAFWLAEAGLDMAVSDLTVTSTSNALGPGGYSTQTSPVSSIRYLVISNGGVPGTDETDPNNIIRTVRAIVEQPALEADPSGITSAITANGEVDIKGSTEVNGDVDENATFDFEEIFGMSKEFMKDNATNLYIDPENNVTPVNNVTWSEIDTIDEMIVSDSNWTGDGILVVDGNLRITGGYFSGIIWVAGSLWVSGNPIIDGTIYVECGAEVDTTLTGTPTISYDSDAISNAFDKLPSEFPPYLITWKED